MEEERRLFMFVVQPYLCLHTGPFLFPSHPSTAPCAVHCPSLTATSACLCCWSLSVLLWSLHSYITCSPNLFFFVLPLCAPFVCEACGGLPYMCVTVVLCVACACASLPFCPLCPFSHLCSVENIVAWEATSLTIISYTGSIISL